MTLYHHTLVSDVIKCVKQTYQPNHIILSMVEIFRKMVNECIKIGLENNIIIATGS